jgi:hypothetical protein
VLLVVGSILGVYSGQFGGVVLWLWVRFMESGGVKYGLTCSKAHSLLNHAKPTQTRLVSLNSSIALLHNDFCF